MLGFKNCIRLSQNQPSDGRKYLKNIYKIMLYDKFIYIYLHLNYVYISSSFNSMQFLFNGSSFPYLF